MYDLWEESWICSCPHDLNPHHPMNHPQKAYPQFHTPHSSQINRCHEAHQRFYFKLKDIDVQRHVPHHICTVNTSFVDHNIATTMPTLGLVHTSGRLSNLIGDFALYAMTKLQYVTFGEVIVSRVCPSPFI